MLGDYDIEEFLIKKQKEQPEKHATFQKVIDIIKQDRVNHNKEVKRYIKEMQELAHRGVRLP